MGRREQMGRLLQTHRPIRLLGQAAERAQRARQLALSVEQSVDLQEAYERQQMILRISTAIRSELDLDAVLSIAVNEVGRAFNASRCAYLPSTSEPHIGPSHQYLAPEAPEGPYPDVDMERNPHVRHFFAGNPVTIADMSRDPYYATLPAMQAIDARSLLSVPVIYHGRILGALSLLQTGQARYWRDDDVTCMAIIADQLAMALRAAAQYAQAAYRARDLEQALAELESVDRLKSSLLATVTHELRTPLNDIIAYASSISDGVFGPVGDSANEALERVLDGGDRLKLLIDEILDASRLASNSLHLVITEIDYGELCRMVLGRFRRQAEAKGLDFRVEIPEQIPCILADPDRLGQVLCQLVENALKFTDAGAVRIRILEQRDGIVTRIEDTGVGIATQHQPHVFEQFYQVDSSHTRRYGGTGLGLYLADRFLAAMGSSLSLESVPGQGAAFWFRLPAAPRARPA